MIVPIKSLADLANTIRETKNYGLRFQYESRDEIGRLADAFNEMLHGLAVAREREIMSQNEIARVSRLATIGAMVASITHEIRQPLAAIVTNSQTGTDTEGVRVTVEDSGIGIDAKKAEQIFEAFFTTKPTGMGMGLAICRSIIAAHDGRL